MCGGAEAGHEVHGEEGGAAESPISAGISSRASKMLHSVRTSRAHSRLARTAFTTLQENAGTSIARSTRSLTATWLDLGRALVLSNRAGWGGRGPPRVFLELTVTRELLGKT